MAESALRQLVPQSAEPFVRSYNPFNPAFRETIRATASDLLGGRAIGGTPSQRYRAQLADLLTGSVDFAPGVSDAVAVSDTVQAARGGDYGTAAILGGAAMLGMVPVIGDSASRAIREGLDMSQAARMQGAAEGAAGIRTAGEAAKDVSFTAYHGTPHVLGPNQLVRDIETGKEYVESPDMVQAIMAQNPGKYEILAENPLGIFDPNRIGTGEGAQAFGEGIYITESPDVGRYYRGSLLNRRGEDDTAMIGSRTINDVYSTLENQASRLSGNAARVVYDKMAIIEDLGINGDVLGVRQNKESYSPEAFEWFEKNIAPKFKRPGALYEVQVSAPKSSFLDWDKPVTEQSPEVLERLQRAGIYDPEIERRIELLNNQRSILAMDRDPVTNMIRNDPLKQWYEITREMDALRRKQLPYMTGKEAYYAAAPNAASQAEASRVLQELGISGISYLDQASRMAGGGSRNYVLFDPKIANITAKYGVMGGAVGLSALNQLVPRNEERRPD